MPEFTEPRRRKPKPAKPAKPAKTPKPDVGARSARPPKVQKPPKPRAAASSARPPKQRRRQNMVIYYAMFFVVGTTIFAILAGTVLFNLEEVITEGRSIYTGEQIVAASGMRAGANLLRLDTESSRRNIISSLVYVDDVTVRRVFPNKVSITVYGAAEMAAVAHEGLFYTISRNGRILEVTRTNRENIIIYGFEADEPIIGGYIDSLEARKTELAFILIKTAEEAGLSGIIDIDMTDHLDIKMNYMDRIVLHVGHPTELEHKLRAAAYIVENDIQSNEQGTLILLNPLQAVFSPE
jgi:cell division septal protein FtsQ